MGGKGGASGGQATNDQLVQMQQQQAAQATQANAERNARLRYGTQAIKNIFEGTQQGATPMDLSAIGKTIAANPGTKTALTPAQLNTLSGQAQQYVNNPNAPSYSADRSSNVPQSGIGANVQSTLNPNYDPKAASELAAGGITTGATPASNGSSGTLANGYSWKALPDDGSGSGQYGIFDGSGNLVTSANSLADLASSKIYTGGTSGTSTSPFGSDFYDKYTKSITDYYMPQEGKQYNDARTSLAASLARAGTLDSSLATEKIGDLANQDQINRAQIASGADSQTAALRTTIAGNEQSALNQLYSTEDPSVAANTAQNMVANASLTKPLLNPASALFAPITVGVGNALSGFTNSAAYINPSVASTGSGNTSSGVSGTT